MGLKLLRGSDGAHDGGVGVACESLVHSRDSHPYERRTEQEACGVGVGVVGDVAVVPVSTPGMALGIDRLARRRALEGQAAWLLTSILNSRWVFFLVLLYSQG